MLGLFPLDNDFRTSIPSIFHLSPLGGT